MLVALLILTAAVTGLAMTARAQQEPTSQEPAPAENTAQEPALAEPPAASPGATPCPPDRILVKLKPGVDAAAIIGRLGGTIIQTIPSIEVHVVNVSGGTGQQVIDALNADPDVEYAEPDRVVRIASESGGC
jgi:hypothetical protein